MNEQQDVTKLSVKHFRLLEPTQLIIKNVYPAYHHGWNETDGKFKSFIFFPNECMDKEVVHSGDEGTRPTENTKGFHLRLQLWDNSASKFAFYRIENPTREFYKLYKKVYDVEFQITSVVEVPIWNKDMKKEVLTKLPAGSIVRIQALPAKRIQDIASAMMLTKGIEKEKVTVTDRTTGVSKEEMRLPFNWEEKIIPSLKDKGFEFAVEGTGLDTRYSYREVQAKVPEPISVDDLPF